MKGWSRVLVLCLAGGAAAARGEEPAAHVEYRLGPRDLVEIRVAEIPELNVERRVAEDGTVALPLIGAFRVEGLTAPEFRDRVEALLTEKFVNRAEASVSTVKDFANKPVTVLARPAPGALTISDAGRSCRPSPRPAVDRGRGAEGSRPARRGRHAGGAPQTLEIATEDLP